MKTYNGDQEIKARLVAQVAQHEKLDQIVQGEYWDDPSGKGCCVGCIVHSDRHSDCETRWGIAEWCAHVADRIHEGLALPEAKRWPGTFVKAIPVGVDWESIRHAFGARLMVLNIARVQSLAIDADLKEAVVAAIHGVLTLHHGEILFAATSAAWSAARSAAWNAARSAGWNAASAAENVAERAAWSAARSAAWSAASAAENAATSAAWSAASAGWSAASAAWNGIKDILLDALAAQAGTG